MPELIRRLARFHRLYIVFVVAFALIALAISAFQRPEYTASITISSPPESKLSFTQGLLGAASLSQQLTGGSESQQTFSYFVQSLTSQQVADTLSDRFNLLPVIFYRKWNASAKEWKQPNIFKFALVSVISVFTRTPVKSHPDAEDLRKYLEKHISVQRVTPITSSGLLRSSDIIVVSFTFHDRIQAKKILNDVLAISDEALRLRWKKDVAGRLAYLHKALKNISGVEEQQALINAIQSQQQEMAKIEANVHFSYSIVVPASSPQAPTSPLPGILLLLAVLAAVAAGTAAVYFLPERYFPKWIAPGQPDSEAR